MKKEETTQVRETTSDLLKQMLTDEKDGQTFTEAFLKSNFLSSAVDALFYARRQAGLTQAQVAELMQTKQAAIARLEADTNGSLSLHRYVEFALACGMVPLDMKLVPISSLYNYLIDHPEMPTTFEAYNRWFMAKDQPLPTKNDIIRTVSSADMMVTTSSGETLVCQVKQTQESFKPFLLPSIQGDSVCNTAENSKSLTVANTIQPLAFISKCKDKGAA